MRTLRSADLTTGVFLTLLGIAALASSLQIVGTAGERLHPRTLPVILSCMMAAGGLALFITRWRDSSEGRAVDWPSPAGFRRIAVTLVSLVVYLALLEPLGFPLSTLVFITFLTRYLGRYPWWVSVLGGVASAVVMLFLFIDLLGLSFPLGPLEPVF